MAGISQGTQRRQEKNSAPYESVELSQYDGLHQAFRPRTGDTSRLRAADDSFHQPVFSGSTALGSSQMLLASEFDY